MFSNYFSFQTGAGGEQGSSDLLEGDLEANLGMNDDDLLGDFGDDFNILEFADALDGNDATKTNILDDLEAEDSKEGEKGGDKPPPYAGAEPHDPSRPPPPPYPGPHPQQKVRTDNLQAWFLTIFL